MDNREPRVIWKVANKALAAMLQNPGYSTVPADEIVAASFRIANLMFATMTKEFPDDHFDQVDEKTSDLIH